MKDEEGILLVIVLQRTNQTCTIKCRQVVGGVHEKTKTEVVQLHKTLS